MVGYDSNRPEAVVCRQDCPDLEKDLNKLHSPRCHTGRAALLLAGALVMPGTACTRAAIHRHIEQTAVTWPAYRQNLMKAAIQIDDRAKEIFTNQTSQAAPEKTLSKYDITVGDLHYTLSERPALSSNSTADRPSPYLHLMLQRLGEEEVIGAPNNTALFLTYDASSTVLSLAEVVFFRLETGQVLGRMKIDRLPDQRRQNIMSLNSGLDYLDRFDRRGPESERLSGSADAGPAVSELTRIVLERLLD